MHLFKKQNFICSQAYTPTLNTTIRTVSIQIGFRHIIGKAGPSDCRWCGTAEETGPHIVFEYTKFERPQKNYLQVLCGIKYLGEKRQDQEGIGPSLPGGLGGRLCCLTGPTYSNSSSPVQYVSAIPFTLPCLLFPLAYVYLLGSI